MKTLSIAFLIIGSLLFLVGLLFHVKEWPDLFHGLISGSALMGMGVIFFVIYKLRK
jgi:hypothetical protein